MSPHMQRFIKTPFFMFNSKYDAWQLSWELQVPYEHGGFRDAVLKYGDDFMEQFSAVTGEGRNGAFITSCVCHPCPWPSLKVANKTAYQSYADWMYGKGGGSTFHVDTRG